MKLVSWNINSVRARLAPLLDWVDRHRPDLVFLQETKVQCCEAASVMKPVPSNNFFFSRCNTDAHRHCQLFLQRVHPQRAKGIAESGEYPGTHPGEEEISQPGPRPLPAT